MTRLVKHLLASTLLLCGLVQVPALAQGSGSGSLDKMTKDLAKLEESVTGLEKRLQGKTRKLELEFKRLSDAEVKKKFIAEIEKLGAELQKENDPIAAKRRADAGTKRLVKTLGGREMVRFLAADLSTNLIDLVQPGKKVPAKEIFSVSVEDAFGDGNFATFAKSSKVLDAYAPKLKQKIAERDVLKRAIKDREAEQLAAMRGVPPGMVEVPAGDYVIGIDEKDLKTLAKALKLTKKMEQLSHHWTSAPAHQASLEKFYIDQREVTNAWYAEYVKDVKDAPLPRLWRQNDDKLPAGFENRPVTGLSYAQVLAFARWMGRRIPTEYEWEAAARFRKKGSKEQRFWPWGTTWNGAYCNCDESLGHKMRRNLTEKQPPVVPVGTFPEGRSILKLDDLAGNAAEWTSSAFRPYPGWKPKRFKDRKGKVKRSVGLDAFEPPNSYVIRGGHGNQRHMALTTNWRIGMNPLASSPYVGFRTALSGHKGKDFIEWIASDASLKKFLVEFTPLPSDRGKGRRYPAIEVKDPMGYATVMSGGWDEARELPQRARWIAIASREANDLRDVNTLRSLAEDGPVLLGWMHTDVKLAKPALDEGSWFVFWRNSFIPEPPPEEGEGEGSKKDDKNKKKPSRRKPRGKKKEEEPEPVPDSLIFRKVGGKLSEQVVLEFPSSPPIVMASRQGCSVRPFNTGEAPDNVFELVWALPVKYQNNKSFTLTLQVTLADGQGKASDFR